MRKRNRKSKLSYFECRQSALEFFEKQSKFKQIQLKFNKLKECFNHDMNEYFENEGIDKTLTLLFDDPAKNDLVVNRVQRSSVIFDADKLEDALGKSLSKNVIIKKYEIVDIDALITYLKECNVNPKIFKSFLSVSKLVDTQELDRLEELGKITKEQVKGCYTVRCQKPYFAVSIKRGQDNGETE